MSTSPSKTAVFLGGPGIGDGVWHLPFIRAIAGTSSGGQVAVIARSSTLAGEWMVADPAVSEVVPVFRAKRRRENREVGGPSHSPARIFLNTGPYIRRDDPADRHSRIYSHAARFSEAHGLTSGRPPPRMTPFRRTSPPTPELG